MACAYLSFSLRTFPLLASLWAALLGASSSFAYVGDRITYTRLTEVRDIEYHQKHFYVATSGGIRRIDPGNRSEKVFRNLEGLEDVRIQALATTENGELWASAESGILYRFEPRSARFSAVGLSYRREGWRPLPRALTAAGPYLLLGTSKGLSFFHRANTLAQINLSRFDTLTNQAVYSILVRGDTVYVGLEKHVYRARFNFKNLSDTAFGNVFDSKIWARVLMPADSAGLPAKAAAKRTVFRSGELPGSADTLSSDPDSTQEPGPDTTTVPPQESPGSGDTTATSAPRPDTVKAKPFGGPYGVLYVEDGVLKADSSGSVSYSPYLRTIVNKPVRLENQVFEGWKSWSSGAARGNQVYIGNPWGLGERLPNGEFSEITPIQSLPPREITSVRAAHGQVFGWGLNEMFRLEGTKWVTVPNFFSPSQSLEEFIRRRLRPFFVRGRNEFMVGTWGDGLYHYNGQTAKRLDARNSCLTDALERSSEEGNFVAIGAMDLGEKRLWLALAARENYRLASYNPENGQLDCYPGSPAMDKDAHALLALGDSLVVVPTQSGIMTYRVKDLQNGEAPSATPAMDRDPTASYYFSETDDFGRLYVSTSKGLYRINGFLQNHQAPGPASLLENFKGQNCRSMEKATDGNLWIGCENGLYRVRPDSSDSLAPAVEAFTQREGLLSDFVWDIGIDTAAGNIWVTGPAGITRVDAGSRRNFRNLEETVVYPNPFRERHSALVFDRIAPGSRVTVFTQAGSAVRAFSPGEIVGGQIRWDGRNQAGHRIKEGIYFYAVKTGSEHRRGKIIVAR